MKREGRINAVESVGAAYFWDLYGKMNPISYSPRKLLI